MVNQKLVNEYVQNCMKENSIFDTQMEMAHLKNTMVDLQKENAKIEDAKDLILGYQSVAKAQKEEIKKLKDKIESLEQHNMELVWMLKRIPKFLRKLFLKVELKFVEE